MNGASLDQEIVMPCGVIGDGMSVVQVFRSPVDHLSGISMRFGTYRRRNRHRLSLCLFEVVENSWPLRLRKRTSRSLVHKMVIDAAGLSDGGWFHFYVPTIDGSQNRLFQIEVSVDEAGKEQGVALWLASDDSRIDGHVQFKFGKDIQSTFGLQAKLITSRPVPAASYPEGLLYSPLSSCNLNCVHCISRHSRKRVNRIGDSFQEEMRQRAEAGDLKWIFTDYSGDIFHAEKKYPGQLDFLFGLGVAIHIDTNGVLLDAEMIERVLHSRVNALSISLDAAETHTFKKIRIGAPDIDGIFSAIGQLVAARERHGRAKDFSIEIGFTLMLSNLHELPLLLKKAAEAGVDGVNCRHLELYNEEMVAESLIEHKAYFNAVRLAAISFASSLRLKLNIGGELPEEAEIGATEPCTIPWGSAVVLANGDVMACCVPGSKVGNLSENSLEEIWNDPVYQRLRSSVNSQNPPSLCRSCHFRGSMNRFGSVAAAAQSRGAKPFLEELT